MLKFIMQGKFVLDAHILVKMIYQQRANAGFREIAAELGDVSASTILRVESGKCPDMAFFYGFASGLRSLQINSFKLD